MEQECKSHGINFIGMSADGDPRLLSSMRSQVGFKLDDPTEAALILCAVKHTHIIYVQDTIHIGTKLRNRLLKPAILMPIGNRLASVCHHKTLVSNTTKSVHLLVRSDICPTDRQNFGSLEKIMNQRMIEALEIYVLDSEGTIMFLRLCKQITNSYLDDKMKPLDKII